MKKLTLAVFSALAALAYGQPNYCGTEMPQHMISWLDNYKSQRHPLYKTQEGSLQYIPLKIHLVGTDDGNGYLKLQYLLDGLCRLNEQYEQVGFYFYIYEGIDYINSTVLYNHEDGYWQVIDASWSPEAANLYYVSNANGNCGYYSGWGDYVVIANSCAGPYNSTVAHELGHYFDLPHTFYGWENRARTAAPRATDERANGSNCATAGDRFCDTPADFISERWSCPYRDTKLDFTGQPYNVDGTLFMSYANDGCQNKFSPEQIDVMHAYLQNERSNLLNQPTPAINDSLGQAELIYPPTNSVNVPANFAQLKWKKTTGATYYHLQVTRYATIFTIDTIVQDTSIVLTNLEPNYNYKWRVRPFNGGSTCSGYTPYSIFTTRNATPIVPDYIITPISCPGESDGAIAVGVSGGMQPYSFRWSTGDSSQLLSDLAVGSYTLTITEASSDSVVISFDITAPEALNAEIQQTGNVLNASVSGGTPPYGYQWSNGTNVSPNTVSSTGYYSLTVTDSHGCSITKTFWFVSTTGIENLGVTVSRIYPNPLIQGEQLSVEVSSDRMFNGIIEMLDNTGRKVFSIDKPFGNGLNKEIINLPALSRGMYFLFVKGDGINYGRKIVVI